MPKPLSCLPWCKPRPSLRRGARKSGALHPPPQDEDRPLGCGWFDSSHELERGLQVQEADADADADADAGADKDALSTLPLGDWLELALRTGCGHPQPG